MREFNHYNYASYVYQSILAFSLNDILTIFKCLLFEIPIIFFGKDKETLTNIVETFFHVL